MKISGLQRYLVRRLGYILITLFLVSFIVFAVTMLLPGNAARLILGRTATDEAVASLSRQMGLYKPWYVQYIEWIGGILQGDAGTSFVRNEPVVSIVIPRFFRSLQLAVLTLITVILVAIPLGVVSAIYRDGWLDRVITSVSYVGVSLPEFVSGTLLITLLAGPVLNIFPATGYTPLSEGVIPWFKSMVLPVTTLTLLITAYVLRQTRNEMIEVLQSEYIRTARLKGLKKRTVIAKHALRNGLLPTITVIAFNFGWLMGSLVVVEEIFSFPGLGRLVVFAIENRDIPLLQFTVLVIAAIYAFSNLGADLLYSYLDPRINYGGSS